MTSKRTISATNETAILSKNIKMVQFARLEYGPLSGDIKRFHTEIGPRTATHPIYGAEVYTGLGDFGGITSDIKESTGGAPIGLQLGLSGVPAAMITTALDDGFFRRNADLMIGFEDENGTLLDDPVVMFSGYMDKVDIVMQQNEANFVQYVESRATNLLSASDLRYTDEDLQGAFAGDLGCEYIYRMSDLILRWGSQGVSGSGILIRGGARGKNRGQKF